MSHKRRILVVDDELQNRMVFTRLLEKRGFVAESVETGELALAAVFSGTYDAILLDYMLPEMSGLDVLKKIRLGLSAIELPVIMVTANNDQDFVTECFESGANDYVEKPVNLKVVVARLNIHIHVKETAEAIARSATRRADDHMARSMAIVNNSDIAIFTLTSDGLVESFNPGAERTFKCSADDALENNFSRFIAEECWDDDGIVDDDELRMKGVFANSVGLTREVLARDFNGETFPAEMTLSLVQLHDQPIYTVILRNISEKKDAENKIVKLSETDALTGLPNAVFFRDFTLRALASSVASGEIAALAFLDLDNFKDVNDACGHAQGDEVLKVISARINSSLRDGVDIVSRTGGDEFQVLFPRLTSSEDVIGPIKRVIDLIAEPIEVAGAVYRLSASAGLAFFPFDSKSLDDLMRMADAALFQAKASGKSCYKMYDQSMHEELRRIKRLDHELRKAVEEGKGLSVHFQPQIDMHSLNITGYECLTRWIHEDFGFIPPDEFIPVAEASDLIISLGQFVYEQGLLFIKELERQGDNSSVVSVNIAPSELAQEDYIDKLKLGLDRHQVPAARIQLEITERIMADDSVDVAGLLKKVRGLGILISIDDFGTGYSSLSYIKNFPIDELKIDKSFIDGLPHDQDHVAITEAVVGMAKAMRLHIVSEGVETAEQLHFLRDRYQGSVQGYLFSKPLPMADSLLWSLSYRDTLPEGVEAVEPS